MNAEGCWRCGREVQDSLFCKFCSSLQPPAQDYYRFFDLDRRLDLDADDLRRRYYRLSRLLHPDHYQRGAPNERRFALDATAILNDAYRTLRDPVARAEYLLREAGIAPPAGGVKRVPQELLEDVFEANEALEELRGGNPSARATVLRAYERFRQLRQQADRELAALFRDYDAGGGKETLVKVRQALDRRSYIDNLIKQMEEGMDQGGPAPAGNV